MSFDSKGTCRLCGSISELQDSHIIPAFVFRWLKQDGPIRHTRLPNRRVQDGEKAKWLCLKCESKLSVWETAFATKLFYPFANRLSYTCSYSDWLLKFCTSVSWRSLSYLSSNFQMDHLNEVQQKKAREAMAVWRSFLNDERLHPSNFAQCIVPFDEIESTTRKLPNNINRYLLRAVEMDLAAGQNTSFIYTKMGPISVIGFIDCQLPNHWRDIRVAVRAGRIAPRTYTMPGSFLDYLIDRAKRMSSAMTGVSDKQQKKIDENVRANLDKFAASGHFRAMMRDAEMFGVDAILSSTKK